MVSVRSLVFCALFAVCASSAEALPITDVYTPVGSPVTLAFGSPISFTHSLIAHGFTPATDIISSANLTLDLDGANGQRLSVTLDATPSFTNGKLMDLGVLTVAVSLLQSDGLLNVVLTKTQDDSSNFSFTRSTLFADGTNGTTAAPEPGSLVLLGFGLLAVRRAVRGRHRRQAVR